MEAITFDEALKRLTEEADALKRLISEGRISAVQTQEGIFVSPRSVEELLEARRLLSVGEVKERLDVDDGFIERMVQDGQLRAKRLGGHPFFDPKEVEALEVRMREQIRRIDEMLDRRQSA